MVRAVGWWVLVWRGGGALFVGGGSVVCGSERLAVCSAYMVNRLAAIPSLE